MENYENRHRKQSLSLAHYFFSKVIIFDHESKRADYYEYKEYDVREFLYDESIRTSGWGRGGGE